jgi:2-dehydro-3-deoxygluconokinase
MPDLYTFGEVMALFLAEDADSVILATRYERLTAGAEANVAVAVSRLGLDAHFYTRLGQDPLGDAVLEDLRNEGVDVSHVRQNTDFTGILVRNAGQSGVIDASYARKGSAASGIEPADIDLSILGSSRWVHLTGITAALSLSARASLAFALDQARDARKRISLDLNIRRKLWSEVDAAEVLFPMAREIDVLIGGVDEYQAVFREQDPETCLSIAVDRGVGLAIMTGGASPVRVRDGSERFDVAPPRVTTVDPVGAGDAFTGGVIAALLAGLDSHAAVVQGSECGASVAAHRGDWAGLPYGVHGVAEKRNLEAIR